MAVWVGAMWVGVKNEVCGSELYGSFVRNEVWVEAVWVGVRTEVMRGWIGEMRVIGQRNERIGLFS